MHMSEGRRTGGFSSTSSPLVGFALRLAKTPSLPTPPPTTLPFAFAPGPNAGNCVTRRSIGRGGVAVRRCELDSPLSALWSRLASGCPRISRWRSSGPSCSSSESSSSDGLANVSSSSRSAVVGALGRGDEERLWKEGGGDEGIG